MRAARVQGCAMQTYRARDVGMWGGGSRLQAEETGMWEYRAGNTGIQRYRSGNVGCKRTGCRDTELRMLGYGARGVGIEGLVLIIQGSRMQRYRAGDVNGWVTGIQGWECGMKPYRDLGCVLRVSRAVGRRPHKAVGCRIQGHGALLARLQGYRTVGCRLQEYGGAGAGIQGWSAVGYRAEGCRAMGSKVKELRDTSFRDVR